MREKRVAGNGMIGSFVQIRLPGVGGGAEGNCIIRRCACESAGPVIVRIAVSVRARAFEDLGVCRWLAGVWCSIRAAATVLRLAKRLASALASHVAVGLGARDLKLRWARVVEIGDASGSRTVLTGATLRDDLHREVVAIDQADIEEIEATGAIERELGQGGGWSGSIA